MNYPPALCCIRGHNISSGAEKPQIETEKPISEFPDFPALMISGGWGGRDRGRTVEVISPNGNVPCTIPKLRISRILHTMNRNTICGGGSVATCVKITPSGWIETHKLKNSRSAHSSWEVDDGIILIGGTGTNVMNKTEMAKTDGSTQRTFILKHET